MVIVFVLLAQASFLFALVKCIILFKDFSCYNYYKNTQNEYIFALVTFQCDRPTRHVTLLFETQNYDG